MTRSSSPSPRRLIRGIASAVATAGLVLGSFATATVPAYAAGTVSISGGDALAVEGESTLQLSGSGFQSVQGGFGGIYVLFGWVDDAGGGSWSPSNGGVTGEDYRYVFDDEQNPVGYQLFVTFPGSSTAYAANGGEIAADGTWSATLKVPGAVFETVDRQQNPATVDCTQVTCGVITIGAHGVKNANNESFTPVTFASAATTEVAPAVTEAEEDAEEKAAETTTAEQDDPAEAESTTAPSEAATATEPSPSAAIAAVPVAGDQSLPLADLLVIIAVGIIVLALVVLAAGSGGYLATKSILLGVSPEALAKVRAKREAKAQRVTLRAQLRSARREARAQAGLAKIGTNGAVRSVPGVTTPLPPVPVFSSSVPPLPPVDQTPTVAPDHLGDEHGAAPQPTTRETMTAFFTVGGELYGTESRR